ncbi:hypothetical protein RND81_04G188800 [Saponaria officinalis]|uniref:SET domain-containing protein n=1 Tax=Saponaria officinalis TaxID=3572 RepID=A0AAW1LMV1_SAPOF
MEEQELNLESFLKWATSIGVTDSHLHSSSLGHSLCVSYFPQFGGRGLAAVRDLKKGELILRVPKSALMTRDSVSEKDRNFALALLAHPSLSSTQVLTVCLLAEMNKGRKSAWYPYLVQLPRSYDTLSSFGPFETKALQVDEAIWLAEKAISKADLDWRGAHALLQQLNLKPRFLTFKAWLWSSATISSRTLHVPWDDAGCLCPVGDLFNYAAPGEESEASVDDTVSFQNGDNADDQSLDTEHFSDRLTDGGYEEAFSAYCFYAKKNYRKNEQVLLSYGTYTNLELLEHYGFLLNENPNDKVFLPLRHDINACHSWPTDSLYIQHEGRPSFALLCALRLWATPLNQRKSVTCTAFSGSQISSENEKKVMNWIISNCHAILRNLPSKIEDDRLLLDAIDKVQQVESLEIPNNLPSVAVMEFRKFTESMALQNGESAGMVPGWMKVKRKVDKWKLGIQWRVRYKQTIIDCISFCSQDYSHHFP